MNVRMNEFFNIVTENNTGRYVPPLPILIPLPSRQRKNTTNKNVSGEHENEWTI